MLSVRERHRLLLDTNILLDVMDKQRPQCEEAREVLTRCNGGGDIGLVSPSSLNDAYYILRRLRGEEMARRIIDQLIELVVIVPMSAEECLITVRSDEPDFEDGLIRACAELNEVDFILTRDAAAFKRSRVRSMTCREYLDLFPE